jgi:hypothetical protein
VLVRFVFFLTFFSSLSLVAATRTENLHPQTCLQNGEAHPDCILDRRTARDIQHYLLKIDEASVALSVEDYEATFLNVRKILREQEPALKNFRGHFDLCLIAFAPIFDIVGKQVDDTHVFSHHIGERLCTKLSALPADRPSLIKQYAPWLLSLTIIVGAGGLTLWFAKRGELLAAVPFMGVGVAVALGFGSSVGCSCNGGPARTALCFKKMRIIFGVLIGPVLRWMGYECAE